MPKIKDKHYKHARRLFTNHNGTEPSEIIMPLDLVPHNSDENVTNISPTSSFNSNVDVEGSSNVLLSTYETDSEPNRTNTFSDTETDGEAEGSSLHVHSSQISQPQTINVSLANWVIKYKISHVALNSLLSLLKPFHNLPLDARTLLVTPREQNIKQIIPGYYHHFGLKNCLKRLIIQCNPVKLMCANCIEVFINIDGLPLAKSSSSQVYPILCSLIVNVNVVDMIGIYHGYDKPKDPNIFCLILLMRQLN